jgi:hypothetical protein
MLQTANADFDLKGTLRLAEMLGRSGADGVRDNHLVHVNDNELQALYDRGGSGTINPYTDRLEFFGAEGGMGAGGRSDSARSGGSARSGSAGGTKSNEAGHNVGSTAGPTGSMGTQGGSATKSAAANAASGKGTAGGSNSGSASTTGVNLAGPNPGDMAGGGIVGPNGYLGMGGVAGFQGSTADESMSSATDRGWAGVGTDRWNEQQKAIQDALAQGASKEQITAAGNALAERLNDYTDRYNTFGEDVGNFFASLLGFNEMMPTFDVNNLSPNTMWGFDPAGLVGGLLGLGIGSPGLGLLFDKVSELAGRPFEIPIGESVFGQPDSPAGAVNDNAIGASNANMERASALSAAAQASSFGSPSAGGPLQTPGMQTNSLTANLTRQNQSLISMDKQFGVLARQGQQQIELLRKIAASQSSVAEYTSNTLARRKTGT